MKGIVRLFFWVMLVFLTNICFAEKEEEFKELNDHLLIPIVTHFSGGKGSATDQIWKMLMDMQTSEGRQFVKKDIELLRERGVFSTMKDSECSVGLYDTKGKINIKNFVAAYKTSWDNKDARCGRLAVFTLMGFEFNMLNNLAMRSNFKWIRIVAACGRSGDHGTVLVEGNSGMTFVVDPWIKNLAQLPSDFPHLSGVHRNAVLMGEGYILNNLFSKPYYDVIFVNSDTIWCIDDTETDKILDIVYNRSAEMQELYDYIKPSFPWWKPYDVILPPTKPKVEEHKN